MPAVPYMAIETSRELFNAIVRNGVDQQLLIEKSGVDFKQLEQSEQRYPVSDHLKIWQAADQLLPSSGIGLRMGEHSDPYNRGIVGLIFSASPDLKTALANKIKYTKILAEHISLNLKEDHDYFTLHYSINDEYFHCYEIERVFSGFLNWVRHFVGEEIYPVQISCQFSKPGHIEQYQKLFNCPIHFDQTENLIVFNKALYNICNSQFNKYLYSILQARADKVLEKLDNNIDFINGIRSLIAGRLSKGNFTADNIACSLHMSKRSFYRKLKEEGSNYQELLDDERKKMALSYLQKNDCQLQNLCYLLGYADNRGFSRAFKRWTHLSPSQYIQQQYVG